MRQWRTMPPRASRGISRGAARRWITAGRGNRVTCAHADVAGTASEERPRGIRRQLRRMVRLVRLRFLRPVLFAGVLPRGRPDRPAAQCRLRLRGRLPGAAARRAVARHLRRPCRPSRRAQPVGRHDVRRLAADRADPDRPRLGVSAAADPGAIAAGPVRRRRIRRIGHLRQRDGGPATPRFLVRLPVRDDHRRPAGRDAAAGAVAATADRGPAVRLGLARAVRRRRGDGRRRVLDPPQPPRDGLVRARRGRPHPIAAGRLRCSRSTRARRPS